jgi:hypothetical protein
MSKNIAFGSPLGFLKIVPATLKLWNFSTSSSMAASAASQTYPHRPLWAASSPRSSSNPTALPSSTTAKSSLAPHGPRPRFAAETNSKSCTLSAAEPRLRSTCTAGSPTYCRSSAHPPNDFHALCRRLAHSALPRGLIRERPRLIAGEHPDKEHCRPNHYVQPTSSVTIQNMCYRTLLEGVSGLRIQCVTLEKSPCTPAERWPSG